MAPLHQRQRSTSIQIPQRPRTASCSGLCPQHTRLREGRSKFGSTPKPGPILHQNAPPNLWTLGRAKSESFATGHDIVNQNHTRPPGECTCGVTIDLIKGLSCLQAEIETAANTKKRKISIAYLSSIASGENKWIALGTTEARLAVMRRKYTECRLLHDRSTTSQEDAHKTHREATRDFVRANSKHVLPAVAIRLEHVVNLSATLRSCDKELQTLVQNRDLDTEFCHSNSSANPCLHCLGRTSPHTRTLPSIP